MSAMAGDALFETFEDMTTDQLMRLVREMLELPFNTGAEEELDRVIEGVEVTSSDSVELHETEIICSTDLSEATEDDIAALVQRTRPMVEGFRDAAIAAWGDPALIRGVGDPTACTFFELLMLRLGLSDVLVWLVGDRSAETCATATRGPRESNLS